MEGIPFCQRNVKGWIGLLSALSFAVLAYAVWIAYDQGGVSGFQKRTGSGRGAPSVAWQPPAAPAAPAVAWQPPAAPVAAPVAWQALAPAPYVPPPQRVAYAQPAAAPVQGVAFVDAVTKATPGGGVRFIGANQGLDLQTAFNRAADVIRPCVVNVSAVRPGVVANSAPTRLIGQRVFQTVGSGVIVDPAGYVVTNHHVIAGATDVAVTRFNQPNRYLTATVVATDPANDLALLRIIGPAPFPAVRLADSAQVEVGDWVLAVGNPFGLGHTVTSGIVSAKRSSVNIGGVAYQGLLQTDAPINEGSSGGPLVNLAGEVIGVNTAIYAPTGVFNGTGFAIPSNRVGAFVSRTLSQPVAQAAALQMQVPVPPPTIPLPPAATGGAWLGVGVADVTPDVAARLAYPYGGGVFVNSVTVDSPADTGEVARGDILVALANQPVQNSAALSQLVAGLQPGQTVPLAVWRKGKMKNLSLTTRPGFVTGP